MIFSILRTTTALITISAACAQGGRTVSARLVYFEPAKGDLAELYCAGPNGTVVKAIPSASVGGSPVNCVTDASGKLVFTKTEAKDQVVATVALPSGVEQAILFLMKNPQPGTYRVLAVDESKSALPPGGTYLCNLAPQNARVTIGEFKYQLAPGKPAIAKQPTQRDGYNMSPVVLESQDGESWTTIKDTMMRFSGSERYFVLLHPKGKQATAKIYKQVVGTESTAPTESPATAN